MPAEAKAVDTFIQQRGKKPETPEDWASVHIIAYPTINDLPEELKNETTTSYYAGTGAGTPTTPDLSRLQGDVTQTEGRLTELGQGNEAMRILQEAIREKTGAAKAPLGPSKTFQDAGLTGMGALSASLNARSDEIQTNFANFSNIIGQMAGQYSDMANIALRKYETAIDQYNNERGRMEVLDKDMRDHEQAIELINLQFEQNKALARLKGSISASKAAAETGGYPKGFWTAVKNGVIGLQKGEEWGTVWNRIHMQFPDVSNEDIDKALGGGWKEPETGDGQQMSMVDEYASPYGLPNPFAPSEKKTGNGEWYGWAKPGEFERWKETQYKQPQDRQFELEGRVRTWMATPVAEGGGFELTDEEKKRMIMLNGFDPEDFDIWV